ncbi:histamine N-methyltransferase-like [Ptychodera flava]|uniref:histamine N-methyltransferase-like n=1 Tax=Ptychodera flava TaxID=63121 RepID=UPI00396A07A5
MEYNPTSPTIITFPGNGGQEIRDLIAGNRTSQTFRMLPVYRHTFASAEDVIEILKRLGFSYSVTKIPSLLMIQDGLEKTRSGKLVLDTIRECGGFLETASDELIDKTLDFLRSERASVTRDGQLMFKNDLQAIVIRKK